MRRLLWTKRPFPLAVLLAPLTMILSGCHLDMWNQPRYEPLEPSTFFADGSSARPLVAGTVPYGTAKTGNPLYEYMDAEGNYVDAFPMEITEAVLKRGQERFNIFCAQCHGRTAQGNGMIVQRGMKQPPSFHEDRLKAMNHGYYYDVITNGFGVMYSYATRVTPEDRWAITAYIRALQLSQDARMSDVPETERVVLLNPESAPAQTTGEAHGHENAH